MRKSHIESNNVMRISITNQVNSRAWRRFINSVFTWVSITLAHGLESRTCPKIADNRGPMGTTVMIHHRSSESTTHMTKNSIAFSKVTWHIYQVPLINCRGEKKNGKVFDRDLKSFPSIRKQVETTKDKTLRSSKSPTPLSPQFSLLLLLL